MHSSYTSTASHVLYAGLGSPTIHKCAIPIPSVRSIFLLCTNLCVIFCPPNVELQVCAAYAVLGLRKFPVCEESILVYDLLCVASSPISKKVITSFSRRVRVVKDLA